MHSIAYCTTRNTKGLNAEMESKRGNTATLIVARKDIKMIFAKKKKGRGAPKKEPLDDPVAVLLR
jgi:hypothetical protein